MLVEQEDNKTPSKASTGKSGLRYAFVENTSSLIHTLKDGTGQMLMAEQFPSVNQAVLLIHASLKVKK